jgi:hypothetical protein
MLLLHRWRRFLLAAGVCLAAFGSADDAHAHGWHNAALTTASLDEWLADVKAAVPDIMARVTESELRAGRDLAELRKARGKAGSTMAGQPRRGGQIESRLTPQQQELLGRKANDCLEALAFMDPKNIFPEEFPRFDMSAIPKYRDTAKKLLRLMGATGTAAVVSELRAELMGSGSAALSGYNVHPEFFPELLQLVKEAAERGDLSDDAKTTLRQAASGAKGFPLNAVAGDLRKMLAELEAETLDLPDLVKLIGEANDRTQQHDLLAIFAKRAVETSTKDLLAIGPVKNRPSQAAIEGELMKRIPRASIPELLQIVGVERGSRVGRPAAGELRRRSPKYAEVKDDLEAIVPFLKSSDETVAQEAQQQVANAFQRAPMGQCLPWLGRADDDLRQLIWKQIEGRIGRADPRRRASYLRTALDALRDNAAPVGQRTAALGLIDRLKDVSAAPTLIDVLPRLPRELWPAVGDTLRRLSGQSFGPRAGDGAAELSSALQQWRAWLEAGRAPQR